MVETGLLRGWQNVVSTTKDPEKGWLIQTDTVRGAYWHSNVLPDNPLMAFLKRTRDGEYAVTGIYDAEGFVHVGEKTEYVRLP